MSVMFTIINVACSWVGFMGCALYVLACARAMMNGEAFTPMHIVLLIVSVVVAFSCGSWIICH